MVAEYSVDYLLRNSGLPWPRVYLALLYRFVSGWSAESALLCLSVIRPDTANSPEAFVAEVGVAV